MNDFVGALLGVNPADIDAWLGVMIGVPSCIPVIAVIAVGEMRRFESFRQRLRWRR